MDVLIPGARLGPYEVLAPLGAGGMGHVYRAKDTRLHRTVAIKVLGPELSGDVASRDRFEREARSIASLNHHHICTLYDVGDHDGNAFLVMELLDGQTLASRLARVKGGLPVAEALSIATAVADALAFAHRHHIVHRDIKPANIMLTSTGVKLVDFGLARWRERDEVTGHSRTQSSLTEPHVVMGTLAYMSPEQLDGRADERSDVFGFGAVLFEMLTGRKAFTGETSSVVIAGIVHTDPPDVSSLCPGASRALDRVVRRCLAKSPEARWQSTSDLVDELRWIAGNPELQQAPVAEPSTSWRPVAAAVAATAIIVVGLTVAALWLQPTTTPIADAVVQFRISSPTGMFLAPPSVPEIALSPDGRRLAFIAIAANGVRELWVRSLDDSSPKKIQNRTGMNGVTWSPDGRHLAFYQSGRLWRIDVASGAASPICELDGGFALTPSWGTNGELLFTMFGGPGPILSVPAAGGQPRAVTTLAPGELKHDYPIWLPDGDHFLFTKTLQGASPALYVGSVSASTLVAVPGISGRTMYGSGHLIFNKNETLFAQPFDVTRLSITGEPSILAQSAGLNAFFASLAVSENGVLAYGGVNSSARSQLSVVDRNGQIVRHLGAEDLFEGVSVSPDGLMVATTVFTDGLHGALSIVDTIRGLPNKLTPGTSGSDRLPIWARDSSSMVFTSVDAVTRASGVSHLVLSGKQRQETIASRPLSDVAATDWSRDGRFIVYSATDKGQADLHLLTLASGTHQSLVAGPFDERDGRLSPDGQSLAYASNESGRIEIYLQSLAGGRRTLRVSTDGGVEPRWRPDGRELFYRSASGGLMAVPITGTRGQMALGAPEQLTSGIRWASRGGPWTYDVMPDGRQFVVNAFPTTTVFPDLTVVLNWPALLKKQ